MPRKTNVRFETAKKIAEKERIARVASVRWCDNLLGQLAVLSKELDKAAVYTEDNLYDPDRVQNLMYAQGRMAELINTMNLLASPAAVKAAEKILDGGA